MGYPLRIGILGLIICLFSPTWSHAEVYRYVDENGTIAYAGDLQHIPENLRSSAELIDEETLPTVTELEKSPFSIPQVNVLERWLDQSFPTYLITYTILAVILASAAVVGPKSWAYRSTIKILFICLIASAGLTYALREHSHLTRDRSIEVIGPVQKTKERIKILEHSLEKQKRDLEAISEMESQ